MAINLIQYSTSPGIGNSNLIHAVTSNSSSMPQFKFVADIRDTDGVLLQAVKQQPNPQQTGVFDLGNIVPVYLGPTDTVWDVDEVTANTACGKDFKIRFGEEYGTSTTGSTEIYPGDSDTPGNPVISGSEYTFLLDGVIDPNDATNWNWASSSKYDEEDTYGITTFTHQNGLTNFDTQSVRLGDYHTLSFLNGNCLGITSSAVDSGFAQDVYAMIVKQYDASGNIGTTSTIYNTTSGLRTAASDLWDDVYLSQTENTRLNHWPVGPQNLEDSGITLDSDLAYYTCEFHSQTPEPGVNTNGVWGSYRFNVTDKNCGYDGVRFAWKNEYGVWDYFNFALAESTTSLLEREQFEQTFVNYSGQGVVAYDKERRGFEQFQNRVVKRRTAQSDYLTQTNADNLRELFFSTNVYVQQSNGEWYPVVIEDASVTEKTNPRTQKLYTYTVNYRYANDTRARR